MHQNRWTVNSTPPCSQDEHKSLSCSSLHLGRYTISSSLHAVRADRKQSHAPCMHKQYRIIFCTLSVQLLWMENVAVFLLYRQAKWTVGYVWQCLHANSVDNSAQCPAVVMLSVKTPLTSLSSPHVIPRPRCCALDHSYITDGRKCPVLCNCVQIKELSSDEDFVFISVNRGAEFQTAVKHRKFK